MAAFSTPGVYIQEIPKLPASVAQVATAIPAFIGYTKINPGKAVRITSMLEFEQNFGGPQVVVTLKKTADIITADTTTISGLVSNLYYSLQLYFANGGGPCYVVSVKEFPIGGTASGTEFKTALDLIALEDEPTLLVSPDSVLLGASHGTFMAQCLSQCATLQDRFTIMDTTVGSIMPPTAPGDIRPNVGSNNLKYGAAYYPNLITTFTYPDSAVKFYNSGFGSNTLINGLNLAEVVGVVADSNNPDAAETAEYLMPILPAVRTAISKLEITVPPSGAIAGIYAAIDASRGVWKAPANVSITSIVGPKVKVNDTEQGDLNIDPTGGKSVNVIRTFTGKGTLVWGARTLAGNDNEWKYINVRRLFITAEESIKKATAFVVFEPNDANTWVRTKGMIENYLTGLWRDGALAGATPQEAFFVNVGLGTTMTSDDILNGRLNIEIGMAAVRPAEFIILNFSHMLQTS